MFSAVGLYTTSFDLPAGWNPAENGALLSLGEVFDSFALSVNGHCAPIDQLSASADISGHLKGGRNIIAVRVATTLNNRLAKIDESVANRRFVQPSGLTGPVVFAPYAKVPVWR